MNEFYTFSLSVHILLCLISLNWWEGNDFVEHWSTDERKDVLWCLSANLNRLTFRWLSKRYCDNQFENGEKRWKKEKEINQGRKEEKAKVKQRMATQKKGSEGAKRITIITRLNKQTKRQSIQIGRAQDCTWIFTEQTHAPDRKML